MTTLFHTDLDALALSARASDIPTNGTAYEVMKLASCAATMQLQTALGMAEATRLAAVPDVCPPTTQDELKRGLAKVAEADLFLAEMLCRLPYLATDGSSYSFEEWDKNNAYRQLDPEEAAAKAALLKSNANTLLSQAGASSVQGSVNAILIGPSTCPVQTFSRPKHGPLIHTRYYGYYGYHRHR